MKIRMFCLVLLAVPCGVLQAPAVTLDSTNALQLLQRASRRYAEAKSYHIEEVSETTISTDLSRNWQKKFVTAIAAPDNRYHYLIRSQAGSRLRVSDGKTEWIYHAEEDAFLRRAAPKDGPAPDPVMMASSLEEFKVTQLRKQLADFAGSYASAESGPAEVLEIGNRRIDCFVIRLAAGSLKQPMKAGSSADVTVWIAKDDLTIRKIASRRHAPTLMSPAVFEDTESTELYPTVELDGTIAESEFTFHPPATAAEVEAFSNPFAPDPSLEGKPAPAVTFKSADGAETTLASFRGKPVLLDFWATWCAPCVASMPEMVKIYEQTKGKGLVFLSVDKDVDAKTATDFLATRHEPWPNYHDGGEITKAFQENGLPFTVLIDAGGKIVYSTVGYGDPNLSELRGAIAALGPEYDAIKTPATH